MPILSRTFYLFSAIHSFLLGLLPIFIPVILWDKGLLVTDIAWFIVLSAVGFLVALYGWDRLRAKDGMDAHYSPFIYITNDAGWLVSMGCAVGFTFNWSVS